MYSRTHVQTLYKCIALSCMALMRMNSFLNPLVVLSHIEIRNTNSCKLIVIELAGAGETKYQYRDPIPEAALVHKQAVTMKTGRAH